MYGLGQNMMTREEAAAKGLIRYDKTEDGHGGMSRERVYTYYQDPGMGATVIPSSRDGEHSRTNVLGFDPDAPQTCVVHDLETGVISQMTTAGDRRVERAAAAAAKQQQQQKASAMAKKAAPKKAPRSPRRNVAAAAELQYQQQELEPMHETSMDDDILAATQPGPVYDVTPAAPPPRRQQQPQRQRPMLSTNPNPLPPPRAAAGAAHDGVRPPGIKVIFEMPGMSLPVLYHHVVLTEVLLAVIFDTRYEAGSPPPVFAPNDEDKPFRIKVGSYELVCNYYGQTYLDDMKREHTVFVVDPDHSVNTAEQRHQPQPQEYPDDAAGQQQYNAFHGGDGPG
jgi:hypothetical protein